LGGWGGQRPLREKKEKRRETRGKTRVWKGSFLTGRGGTWVKKGRGYEREHYKAKKKMWTPEKKPGNTGPQNKKQTKVKQCAKKGDSVGGKGGTDSGVRGYTGAPEKGKEKGMLVGVSFWSGGDIKWGHCNEKNTATRSRRRGKGYGLKKVVFWKGITLSKRGNRWDPYVIRGGLGWHSRGRGRR